MDMEMEMTTEDGRRSKRRFRAWKQTRLSVESR